MSSVLPSRIQMYWNAAERPDYIEERVDSWRSVYPEFDLTVLDWKASEEFLLDHRRDFPGTIGDALAGLFRAARLPAMQADVIRVGWTYLYGGLYADATITALQRLEPLIPSGTSVVVYRRWNGNINNGLFWAEPRSPFIEGILGQIEQVAWQQRRNNVFDATGPGQFNGQVARWSGRPELTILEHETISTTYVGFSHDFPHKKGGRHWSEMQERVGLYRDYLGAPRRVLVHFGNSERDAALRSSIVAERKRLADNGIRPFPVPSSGLLRRRRPAPVDEWPAVRDQVWEGAALPEVFAGVAYRRAQRAVADFLELNDDVVVVSEPALFGSPHHRTSAVAASLFFDQDRIPIVTEMPGPKALRLIEELTGAAPVLVTDVDDLLALSSGRARRP